MRDHLRPPEQSLPVHRLSIPAVACAAWLAVLGALTDIPLTSPAAANEAIGRVGETGGSPVALFGHMRRPLYADAGLFGGDRIQIADGGRLEVFLLDGSKITFGENSDAVLQKLIYSEPNQAGEARLSLSEGTLHLDTGSIERAPNFPILLTTPLADIKMRSANAWVGMMKGELTVGFLQGSALIIETDGGAVTLDQPGTAARVAKRDAAPGRPFQLTGEQITEAIGQLIDTEFILAEIGLNSDPVEDGPSDHSEMDKAALTPDEAGGKMARGAPAETSAKQVKPVKLTDPLPLNAAQ